MGAQACSLYMTKEDEDRYDEQEAATGQKMTAEEKKEDKVRTDETQRKLDKLFESMAENLKISGATLKIIIDQKASTERNIQSQTGIADDLSNTSGMLAVMQRGLFSFSSSTPAKRAAYPNLPEAFCNDDGQFKDLRGMTFFITDPNTDEQIQEAVTLRFAGSFAWVLDPDTQSTFSSTIPYQSISQISVDSDKRLVLQLKKAGVLADLKMGVESKPVKGKTPTRRYREADAPLYAGHCSIEEIAKQFMLCSAAVGNRLELKYLEGTSEAFWLKDIDSMNDPNGGSGRRADQTKDVMELLEKTREKLETETDGQIFNELCLEASNQVLDIMLDNAQEVGKELNEHLQLLDVEFDMINDNIEMAEADVAAARNYIAMNT